MEKPTRVRINLGSGNQPYQYFTGLDWDGWAADIVHDLTQPLPFPDDSVDELVAIHVVEHFPNWQISDLLRDWCRVLKPQTGLFWGIVPDGEAVARRYIQAIEEQDRGAKQVLTANFYGGFTNNAHIGPGQIHHALYDDQLLTEVLSNGGFHPIVLAHERAGPFDYRLNFFCGKGMYVPMDIDGVINFRVPWAAWRHEEGWAGRAPEGPPAQ